MIYIEGLIVAAITYFVLVLDHILSKEPQIMHWTDPLVPSIMCGVFYILGYRAGLEGEFLSQLKYS